MIDLTERRTLWVLGGVAVSVTLIALNTGKELAEDDSTSLLELALDAVEIVLMVIGAGGVGLLLDQARRDRQERQRLAASLATARQEGEGWRRRMQAQLAGLGAEIGRQFEAWSLTGAEGEIGLLILKGLSHKEIAALRGTSEATVRHQARSVYQKAGLGGKAAFSAYFLEDLLPPAAASMAATPTSRGGNGSAGNGAGEPANGALQV